MCEAHHRQQSNLSLDFRYKALADVEHVSRMLALT